MQSVLGPGHLVSGRYRLLDQIGRGAMGIVWRSRDELLDREVAVKQIVLQPMASAADAEASYARTLREARTAARLSHPGVVTVFDVVEEDSTPWIVMELIRARPLDQVIAEDGPLPPAHAAQLGLGLLDALATAHGAGVLHRDVKPSNVLISGDGKAVLTDFGIATIQGDPGFTQAGMVVGTPGFAPPERVRGDPATPASDLWSLGATLYAAVEGRGPFDRAGGSAAIIASVATEPAPRAPSAGPLGPVIEMLLRADPARRPDAVTTARMLIAAESAANSTYSVAGLPPGSTAAAAGGPASWPEPGAQTPDVTTATQIVMIPETAEAGAGVGVTGAGAGIAGAAAAGADAAGTARLTGPPGAGSLTGRAGNGSAPLALSSAADVVPDLMATPIFAELRMPAPAASPDLPDRSAALTHPGPLGQPGRPVPPTAGHLGRASDGSAGPVRARRGLALLAAAAAATLVIGGVWLEFPGLPTSLAQSLGVPESSAGTVGHRAGAVAHKNSPGAKDKARPSSGASGTADPSRGHTPAGRHTSAGQPSPSGGSSPSGKPSPSSSPTPSVTPTPSATSTPTGPSLAPPPAGYVWQSVTGLSIGTTAGFRVAALAPWIMTPALDTIIRPLAGSARLGINLAPFPVHGPVKVAKYRQAKAIAQHRYHLYHLVSILAVTFHGRPAATWEFWWRPRGSVVAIDVTQVIFTARTSAGPQPYVLSMSAPASRAAWASRVFRVAMRTFKVLP